VSKATKAPQPEHSLDAGLVSVKAEIGRVLVLLVLHLRMALGMKVTDCPACSLSCYRFLLCLLRLARFDVGSAEQD
jgi:hypothetical protein